MTSPRPVDPDRLRLMVITDRRLAGTRGVERVVELALEAGAPAIQLREKAWGAADVLPLAQRLREMTRAAGALFIVNDRVDLALAVEADGVHLGPDDLPLGEVRRYVGESLLLGYSTDDPARALVAEGEGADYVGCGTVWPTSSKQDAGAVIGPEGLARVAGAVTIPVLGIGGITPDRSRELAGTGAAGVAVVGAVMAAPDPREAVVKLLRNVAGEGG
ncbi:MAG: thiamine phosphate synthase [Gemmatimonadales bacterium]|nr:MAG: thiamine phosphate synthase [Gemmatimonadales bacterium]